MSAHEPTWREEFWDWIGSAKTTAGAEREAEEKREGQRIAQERIRERKKRERRKS